MSVEKALELMKTLSDVDKAITPIERGFLIGTIAVYIGVTINNELEEMKKQ